jgi:catechol 2,3-dioxygenase-like lactoylglutathione lyase family enzyme
MRPRGVLETCLYVDDLSAARQFYQDVLGLELVSQQEGRHVFFHCGQGMLLLFDPRESGRDGDDIPPHGATGSGHVAFAVEQTDLDLWSSHLAAAGVAIEKVVDWPQGGRSLYFRDPAGNSLELTTPSIWGL